MHVLLSLLTRFEYQVERFALLCVCVHDSSLIDQNCLEHIVDLKVQETTLSH